MSTLFDECSQLCCTMPQFPQEWIQVTHSQQGGYISEVEAGCHRKVMASARPLLVMSASIPW